MFRKQQGVTPPKYCVPVHQKGEPLSRMYLQMVKIICVAMILSTTQPDGKEEGLKPVTLFQVQCNSYTIAGCHHTTI